MQYLVPEYECFHLGVLCLKVNLLHLDLILLSQENQEWKHAITATYTQFIFTIHILQNYDSHFPQIGANKLGVQPSMV